MTRNAFTSSVTQLEITKKLCCKPNRLKFSYHFMYGLRQSCNTAKFGLMGDYKLKVYEIISEFLDNLNKNLFLKKLQTRRLSNQIKDCWCVFMSFFIPLLQVYHISSIRVLKYSIVPAHIWANSVATMKCA